MKCNILLRTLHFSKEERRWDGWKQSWQVLSFWGFFSCAVPFLAIESLVIYLGWHLGFKIDQLSFQQSEGDVRKKIFLQHSFKGFNILFSCHNFPFDSIHKLLFAKNKKIPLESAHCHGGRFLPWYDKWREMHCEQRNVFVILSRRMKDIDVEGEML